MPLGRRRTVTEPESEDDHKLVRDFKSREEGYKERIQELVARRDELREENKEVQAEWHKMQMQGSELQKVDRKIQEIEFSMREKNKEIIDRYSLIINKLEDGPEGSFTLLDFRDQIKALHNLLQQQKKVDLQVVLNKRRLENHFSLNQFVEQGYLQQQDEDVKILMSDTSHSNETHPPHMSALLRSLPNLFNFKHEAVS